MFRIFEGRALRMIYIPIKGKGIWRTRHSTELYALCNELDIVKVMKTGRMKWLGQLFRMQELDPCRKFTVLKPVGTRCLGKPKLG
jgi:hypothetical protein